MVAFVLCFVGGVWALQAQAELPARAWMLAGVPALFVLLLSRQQERFLPARRIALFMLAIWLGFHWAAWRASLRLSDELPALWEGRDVQVIGVVAGLPQPFARGIRFEFDVESVATPEAIVPRRLSVAWYGSWRSDADDAGIPQLHVGERWAMMLRLRRPHGTVNPHGFDYEAWLLERGIRATGYVRPFDPPRRLAEFVLQPSYIVESVRERLRERILSTLQGTPCAGVIAALVMGDQRAITSAQWTVFTRTGVNHLMSISGLHVTMVGTLAYVVVGYAWRRSARLVSRVPAQRAAALGGFVAALVYAGVAGFAVPAQRTVYMIGAAALAVCVGQVNAASAVLAFALMVATVLDPWAPLSPGFWLSFGAVAVLFYVGVGPLRRPHWFVGWAQAQWAVTLGLVPLLLAMFQQISLVSPLANALAIPVVSFVVVPLALLGTVPGLDGLLQFAQQVMAWMLEALQFFASMPDAVWQQHAPPSWTLPLGCLGVAWCLAPRGWPGRWVGVVLLLPLFTERMPAPAHGHVHVAVLDVGQGLSVVVRTANHALLYDTGPMYSPEADSGSRIVVPYLRAAGIRRLDGLIVSHADNDHSGGTAAVVDALPVGWMASSLPRDHLLNAYALRRMPCFRGQSWRWDDVDFEVLHPSWESYGVERMKSNDRSCVLMITAGGRRMLLAGDIEARSERELLAKDAATVRADILVVPHHGSTTSSTPEFVAAVAPQIAVFTSGYRNRFGHPRPQVLQRYIDQGSRLLRSDWHGAIRFEIGSDATSVALEREVRRRYWHDPPN